MLPARVPGDNFVLVMKNVVKFSVTMTKNLPAKIHHFFFNPKFQILTALNFWDRSRATFVYSEMWEPLASQSAL